MVCVLALGSVAHIPSTPSPARSRQPPQMVMKIDRFVRHNEAREALALSMAGVTAIMLIESLLSLILY